MCVICNSMQYVIYTPTVNVEVSENVAATTHVTFLSDEHI